MAAERCDGFLEYKSQTTIERLRAMADRLEESGTESLGRERKTNTANRAAIAAAAERTANVEIALAKTMRNIAAAVEAGEAPFLAGLRTRSQVELFGKYLRRAHSEFASQQGKALDADSPGYNENNYRRFEEEPLSENDVRFVKYPVFRAYRGDLASLGRELMEVEGAEQLGASLLKDADDISEEYVSSFVTISRSCRCAWLTGSRRRCSPRARRPADIPGSSEDGGGHPGPRKQPCGALSEGCN